MKAIAIESVYSREIRDQADSITPDKPANFTILSDNPVTCDAKLIKDIKVWGTVVEGKKQPVGTKNAKGSVGGVSFEQSEMATSALDHALKIVLNDKHQ